MSHLLRGLFTVSILVFSITCYSDETKASRKGFHFSILTLGGMEVYNKKDPTFGNGLRLGWGLSENFLLYLEARPLLVSVGSEDADGFFDAEIKGQYYPLKNLYVNLGAGPAVNILSSPPLLPFGKTGFALSNGAGYEFRIGEKFFIAPELRIGYVHLETALSNRKDDYLLTEGGVVLGWHF